MGVKTIYLHIAICLAMIHLAEMFSLHYKLIKPYPDDNLNGNSNEVAQLNLSKKNRLFQTEVSLGNPPQQITFKLSTTFQGLVVADKNNNGLGFDASLSSTFQIKESSHSNNNGKGLIGTDVLRLSDIAIPDLPFLLASEAHFPKARYQGILGLGYSQLDRSENNDKMTFDFFQIKMKRKVIAFRSTSEDAGIMTLGDIPSYIKESQKSYKTCPVVSGKKKTWQCMLNAIYTEDFELFRVNTPIDFILGGNIIGVNEYFFSFMRRKYFAAAIEEKQCRIDHDDIFIGINCKLDFDLNQLGVLSFVFGKKTVKVPLKKLFYIEENEYNLAIVTEEGINEWFISPSVFANYDVIFDKDEDVIGIYANSS